MAQRPLVILTDIEGTTTPVAFVHDILFPYARQHLADFLALRSSDPEIVKILAEIEALDSGRPPLASLLAWMDADAKVTPLKTLQGMIWDEGYRRGELRSRLYPDVPPALKAWHAAGSRLYVYSSGSEAAQRLIFGYSDAGDLSGLFRGFFDTRVGPKREAISYTRIAHTVQTDPASILFLSDSEAELDAAAEAGFVVCQLVRPADKTVGSQRHPTASDFTVIDSGLK